MTESLLALNPRGEVEPRRACIRRLPYSVEHVVSSEGGFDFSWSGASAYLALHDIVLNDGGMAGDEVAPVRVLDMRRRMTFLPHGVRVAGWCEPIARNNAFSVLYFDQDWLFDELEVSPSRRSLHPMVYFQNGDLMSTMAKLARLAQSPEAAPQILMDSHVIAAGAELLKTVATDTSDGRLREALERGEPLCLVLCDIDHFKKINDTWGHPVGDQVIRYVASILRAVAPRQVCAARYGGEEFAVLLPRTSLSEAEVLAQELCRRVGARRLSKKSSGELLGAVTISVGVALLTGAERGESLVRRADASLYEAKRTGRNRVVSDFIDAAAA